MSDTMKEAAPQSQWQSLTDREWVNIVNSDAVKYEGEYVHGAVCAAFKLIEAKLREKNEALATPAPVPAEPTDEQIRKVWDDTNLSWLGSGGNPYLAFARAVLALRAPVPASPVSAAAPTALLHKTYDALLDIQKLAGVIVAPSLLRELYEAITAPSVNAAAPEAVLQLPEALNCLADVMSAANRLLVGLPPSEKEAKLRAVLAKAHDWYMAERAALTHPPTASEPVNAAPAGEPSEVEIARLADLHGVVGTARGIKAHEQRVAFAHAVAPLYAAPAASLRDAETTAREAVELFKSRWYAVPTFGNRVNKATREAITFALCPIVNLPAVLDSQRLGREKEQP